MDDVLEISSDSDGAPTSTITGGKKSANDFDIENLVNKYIKTQSRVSDEKYEPFTKSDKEYTTTAAEPTKKLDEKLNNGSYENENFDVAFEFQSLKEKYNIAHKSNETSSACPSANQQSKKEQKQMEKAEKLRERERKKEEIQREKALKQALNAANKNLKPDECLNFICVHIDRDIAENRNYGPVILAALQNENVAFQVEAKIFPNTITWTRKLQTHVIDDDGNLAPDQKEDETDELLLIMDCQSFIEAVNNRDGLTNNIQSLKTIVPNKKVSLAIYGLIDYFKYQKSEKRRELLSTCETSSKRSKVYGNLPTISWDEAEMALTELQLLHSCSYRLVATDAELADMVFQFTKAIAQHPYKLKKQEKYEKTNWYIAGDNKDCVKVDKDGNGLTRLWNQILTTFPLARLETAEAISSKYPTMNSLMQAYSNCSNVHQAEKLLQDIPIRRAAGPLTSNRKIGPELSKKIYHFFTSHNGDYII